MSKTATKNNELSHKLMHVYEELSIQKKESKKHAEELSLTKKELVHQNHEKEKCNEELLIANKELVNRKAENELRKKELAISNRASLIIRERDDEYFGHLAAIVESSDDAIISKSLDGIIKSWNSGSEKMFGYTAGEAIGKSMSLIVPLKCRDEEKIILQRIRNNETIDHFETIRRKKSGEQFYVSLTVSPLKDPEGNIIGISKIARDITFAKRSEATLIRANEALTFQNQEKEKRAAELIIANKELDFQNKEKENRAAELIIANKELTFQNREKEKRAAELTIANKELEQFSYIASHDLQEPLRTVSNYMKVFEEDYVEQLDDNARKYISSVNNATRRMSLLIKSLLDFSRLGRNTYLANVDSRKLIYDVMADLDTMIRTSGAIIEVGAMPQIDVYEIELRQLFQNLIINAIKFRKKDRRLKIRMSSEKIEETWKFSVSDNGIGIAPEHFERVFDIFQRLQNAEKQEGNGIGLSNCKKIVQMHHGEIWIESNGTEGTTFYFTIPPIKK